MWMVLLPGALGLLTGGILRGRIDRHFSRLYRTWLLGLDAPLALLVAWQLQWQAALAWSAGLLLAGEILAVGLGWWLLRARHGRWAAGLATGSMANTGFWSLPLAAAAGPAALTFCVLYDQAVALPRMALQLPLLRRGAPRTPSRRSAWVDYSPQLAILLGLALRWWAPPVWSQGALQVGALALGACGFFFLAQAWPAGRPSLPPASCWLLAGLRFAVAPAVLGVAVALGLDLAPGSWITALACGWFAFLSWSKLYGYDPRIAAGVLALTLPLAALCAPWAWAWS